MFYALIVGLVIHRELKFSHLVAVFKKSVLSSAVIMFIIANAGLFAFLITRAGIPEVPLPGGASAASLMSAWSRALA